MKLLATITVVSLAIAATAAVFAIWPVVADAPWEDSGVDPFRIARCEAALQLRDTATRGLIEAEVPPSSGPGAIRLATGNSAMRRVAQEELDRANAEIEEFC